MPSPGWAAGACCDHSRLKLVSAPPGPPVTSKNTATGSAWPSRRGRASLAGDAATSLPNRTRSIPPLKTSRVAARGASSAGGARQASEAHAAAHAAVLATSSERHATPIRRRLWHPRQPSTPSEPRYRRRPDQLASAPSRRRHRVAIAENRQRRWRPVVVPGSPVAPWARAGRPLDQPAEARGGGRRSCLPIGHGEGRGVRRLPVDAAASTDSDPLSARFS